MVGDSKSSRSKPSHSEDEIENVPVNHNLLLIPLQNNSDAPAAAKPTKVETTTPAKSMLVRTPKTRYAYDFVTHTQSARNHPSLTPRVTTTSTSTSTTTATATASYSETTSSAHNTPTKSVTKPPNPGFLYSNPRSHANPTPTPYSRTARTPCVVNTLHVPHFDLKENPSFWMDHNVQVIIRVRPLNGNETSMYGYNRCVKQDSAHCINWIGQPDTRFTFDHVACETVDQEMLFRMAGLPMVENCLSGYNSCMFAYGQTGSGKTYTMLGEMEDVEFTPSPHRGMTPRIFEFLFARISAEEESRRDEKLKYSCKCSFLEIYNEQITDLLDPSSTNLLLREDVKKGVYVENLSEFEVHTVGDVLRLLIQGSSNRKVAATNMNRESSRSHCVFICIIESTWERDSVTNSRFAQLNLVDLAGSERQKSSGAEGERLKEAANINKSLSTLGHVIMLLVDIAHGKPRHIPYRDSRLTFLLQDSLGGNSKTMIIANVSPSVCCAAETLNTLKFAQRAKLIQNNAIVNEDSSGDVAVLQNQILLLKEELSALKRQNVSRSLAFDPSTGSIRCQEKSEKEIRPESDQLNAEHLLDSESNASLQVSSKQFKSLEMMLAGALRREQMTETSMKQLEAEIEQLNRLVRQREEDTRCTKMMLKFREDKIQRMESLLGQVMPVDAYLLEENAALSEEIQMLRAKVDRNPEVTRFAVENIRLLEELRRFQDFYEEGERDLLMNEVSELRAQLIGFHDNHMHQHIVSGTAPDTVNDSREKESLSAKLTQTANELAECQTKLMSSLETNSKLNREIEELHAQLKNKDLELCAYRNILDAMKDLHVPNIASQTSDNGTKHEDCVTAEELVNLELELDILKIILKEEKLSRCKMEELASSLTRDAQTAEQQLSCINKQRKDAEAALVEAKSVIQALESQQFLSMAELEELKNCNGHQISALTEQASKQEFASCLKRSDCVDASLQEKMKRMQASLEKAKRLNMWYQSDHAYQRSNEEEMDEVRRQAEAETAAVIVCLQEELSVLQQHVHESDLRGKEAENKVLILETKLKKLHEDFERLSSDNEVLSDNLHQKETEIKMLSDDWELLSSEIEEALMEGHAALISVSDELDSTSTSSRRGWISEQVGQIIRQISDKESLIEELNNCLEEANTNIIEMEHMLMSLKSATMVMSEAHQQECSEKEKEIVQLRSELQASISAKKENMYTSEKNSLASLEVVEVGLLSLQAAFTDFEKQCQGKFPTLYHKLNKLEERTKEAKSSWHQTKELLEHEVVDSKAATAKKAVEASHLLVQFEEVQETMKEADTMINGLMIVNETMKLEIEDLRAKDLMLTGEIDRLVNEVQTLQSVNDLKDQKCSYLENQLVLDASETASLVAELQGLVLAIQDASEEAFMSLTFDFRFVKSHIQDTLIFMHSSLEEIWSGVVSKDCTLSVQHLCHIGMLSEAVTVINSDLHQDAFDSKLLINDLREENVKLNKEIDMCQLVKQQILSDIDGNFKCISSKEIETRKLDLELHRFKESLMDLQHQEEVMLETCNFMGSKLSVLQEELSQSNLTVSALLLEQETMHKSNAQLIDSQAELFGIELYAKELQVSFLASELQQLAQHKYDMDKQRKISCIALDFLVKEFVTQNILADFGDQLLLEKESEVVYLQTTIEKAQDRESKLTTQLQALSVLSSKVARSADSVEAAEFQTCRMLNQLEQSVVLVLNQMSEDNCQNMELVSKLMEELERVEHIAKEIEYENQSLNEALIRKDEAVNAMVFDLRLLQESDANSKDQQDQIKKIKGLLESTECDLAAKSHELDEAVSFGKALGDKVKTQGDIISAITIDMENANLSLKLLSDENEVLKAQVKDIKAATSSLETELCEKRSVIDSMENELLEMGNTLGQMNVLVESLKSHVDDVNCEKDHLQKELLVMEGKLATTHALSGENEAIALEAQQIAESRRIYAEEKEEEVQLLERSVQELDSTISVLENKVDALKEDAERQRLQREELELELHSFKNQMQSVEFADSEIKRHLDEKTRNLEEALTRIKVLENDLTHKDAEVTQSRTYISELSLHAEAQACEYKQKFKELEAMLEQFRSEAAPNQERNTACNKLEKIPSKARGSASPFKGKGSSSPFKGRGSGSPFKCIGQGLVNQLKSDKDEEINAERLRIEELEAVAASRQKEIFTLNARLAATESMTYDVIRDLLGVKLDMSNCANMLDKQQMEKIREMDEVVSGESQDERVVRLKKQLNVFMEERKRWVEEIDRRESEVVAAQIALEKLREQELFLSTENNVLKRDLTKQKRQVVELENEVNKLSGEQKLQQRIHHHAKIKEENNVLKKRNEELSMQVGKAEAYLKRVRRRLNKVDAVIVTDDYTTNIGGRPVDEL